MNWTVDKIGDLSSKVVVITGANAGLGFETSKIAAGKGAKVIMACRNLEKAEKAKEQILKDNAKADLEIMQLDLASLKSVRSFADEFNSKYKRLDVLINNAGIMVPPFSLTEDSFESQMGANYFGHFLLNGLLLDTLNSTEGARIVMLSSIAHRQGKIDFDNLNAEKSYSRVAAYNQSKLACLMHAFELQYRLESSGSKVKVVAAHPGVSNTELGRYLPTALLLLILPVAPFILHSPKKAALPSAMAAFSDDVKGGDYFGPTGFMEMKGKPGKAKAEPHAFDKDVSKRLFEVSEQLTGFTFSL
jgi:NAD(P)-dependent dehydrogenase (short-subunit alcohol dehydrogenase family)